MVFPDVDPSLQTAARRAFEIPYEDPNRNVEALIDCMDSCRKEWAGGRLYAPYVAVVQGSMMGKSRLFHMLPEHDIFVFYICLGDSGFPESILSLKKRLTSDACTEGFYAAFLISSLEAMAEFRRNKPSLTCTEWFNLQGSDKFWKPILGALLCCFSFFAVFRGR